MSLRLTKVNATPIYLAIIILTNSSQLICPSPSTSASRIISSTSSSVSFSPKLVITCRSSAAEIKPLPSRSKTLKASMSSSSVSVSFILQIRSRDKTIAIAVENFEGFDELFLRISVLHLAGHQRKEFREIDCSISIGVYLVDHILQFCFGWVLTKGAHDCAQLLGGDGTIAVLVEEREGLLEFRDLLLGKLVRHC